MLSAWVPASEAGWRSRCFQARCRLAAKPSCICQLCTASATAALRRLLHPLPVGHQNPLCNLCWRQQLRAAAPSRSPPAPAWSRWAGSIPMAGVQVPQIRALLPGAEAGVDFSFLDSL